MNADIPVLPERILFFDGLCHFCNASVQFTQKRDTRKRIFFTPLQGETAALMLPHLDPEKPQSVVYHRKGKTYYKSSAVFRIAQDLDGLWPICNVLLIIPAFLRNLVYDAIARNRYKWFGKRESCKIPTQEEKDQYLP